jgi:arabinogalactan oligomer/maltooligosaccharide transport system substrate-binding protein
VKRLRPASALALALASLLEAQEGTRAVTAIALWTQESAEGNAYRYVQALAGAYAKVDPNIGVEVIGKKAEALCEDFRTAAQTATAPDLLWTVSDHATLLSDDGLIQPVDKLFDLSKYASANAVRLDEKTWGLPISSGNHLMLMYNKDLLKAAPKDTDELVKLAPGLNAKGIATLVYSQNEPFWLVPWLGGCKGSVFAADGRTPTLDTPEMVKALTLLQDLKFKHKVLPAESDYNAADMMFKEGRAAMIITGDWALGEYRKTMGNRLGVARIPQVKGAAWPAPYTAGKFFLIPKDIDKAKLDAVVAFVKFATNKANQIEMFAALNRLPALKDAARDKAIAGDPILNASAEQMLVGIGIPSVVEMGANWDAMKSELVKVMANSVSPAEAAKAMQAAAEARIMKSRSPPGR